MLDEGRYQRYLVDPGLFSAELESLPRGSLVVADEVQRLPGLLNVVHQKETLLAENGDTCAEPVEACCTNMADNDEDGGTSQHEPVEEIEIPGHQDAACVMATARRASPVEHGMWEVYEVLRRVHGGEAYRSVARATGRSPETVRRYVRLARKLGWLAGGDTAPDEALAARVVARPRPGPQDRLRVNPNRRREPLYVTRRGLHRDGHWRDGPLIQGVEHVHNRSEGRGSRLWIIATGLTLTCVAPSIGMTQEMSCQMAVGQLQQYAHQVNYIANAEFHQGIPARCMGNPMCAQNLLMQLNAWYMHQQGLVNAWYQQIVHACAGSSGGVPGRLEHERQTPQRPGRIDEDALEDLDEQLDVDDEDRTVRIRIPSDPQGFQ